MVGLSLTSTREICARIRLGSVPNWSKSVGMLSLHHWEKKWVCRTLRRMGQCTFTQVDEDIEGELPKKFLVLKESFIITPA